MFSLPRLRQLALLGISAACIASAHAALHLTVVAQSATSPNPGATVPPDAHREFDVVLGDTFISSRLGDQTTVYDFAHRRQLALDAKTRTYVDYSLFDVVGFRELELRNREGLAKILGSMKAVKAQPGQVDIEHVLSVQRGQAVIEQRADGDGKLFSTGGEPLLRRSDEGTPVSAADAARFSEFLRYVIGGHPAILVALRDERRIPAHIVYTFHETWGTQTVRLDVSALHPVDAPASFVPAGYALRSTAAGGDRIDVLLDRAWNSQAAPDADSKRRALEGMAASFREHHALEAFLTAMEWSLSSGEPMPAFTDEQKAQLQADPAMRQLAPLMAPTRDKAALAKAVEGLQWLRPQAGARRHMLALFEANDRVALGDFARARELFADVLEANPALAGAWKDAGDFFFRTYDTPRAWRCWDIGRRLAPQFGNLAAITRFEQTLATDFPGYF